MNTQNTALHRDVIPSYYFIPMGSAPAGIRIDRYGDIFSGYFSQACARHLGHSIRAGTPVAEHRRNAHRYLRDATQEMAGIWVLEDLLPWLFELRLDGQTYAEAYLSLSGQLEDSLLALFRDSSGPNRRVTTFAPWPSPCAPGWPLPAVCGGMTAMRTATAIPRKKKNAREPGARKFPQSSMSCDRLQMRNRTKPRAPKRGDRVGFSLSTRDRYLFTLQTLQTSIPRGGFDLIWNDGST